MEHSVRRSIILLLTSLALLVLAACRCEDDVFPWPTPPDYEITSLTSSQEQAGINENVIITATGTKEGYPIHGDSVRFTTTLGYFVENGSKDILKRSEDGSASVTLTSSEPGMATITASLLGDYETITVEFIEPDTTQ